MSKGYLPDREHRFNPEIAEIAKKNSEEERRNSMEGRRLYTFTVVQLLAGAISIWVLATWKSSWNAERYVGLCWR